MRPFFPIALVLIAAVAAWFVLGAGSEGSAGSCRDHYILPGGPVVRHGDDRLAVGFPAAWRDEGEGCFFGQFDPMDLQRFDGALFNDCVIWLKDGEETVADDDFGCVAVNQ